MLRCAKGNSVTFIRPKLSVCSEATVLTNGGRPSTETTLVMSPISSTCVWLTIWDATKVIPVLSYGGPFSFRWPRKNHLGGNPWRKLVGVEPTLAA